MASPSALIGSSRNTNAMKTMLRDCSHMTTYNFRPSRTRYLLCHKHIIIWVTRYLRNHHNIINPKLIWIYDEVSGCYKLDLICKSSRGSFIFDLRYNNWSFLTINGCIDINFHLLPSLQVNMPIILSQTSYIIILVTTYVL